MTRFVIETTPEQETIVNQFCKEANILRSMLVRRAVAEYIAAHSDRVFPLNNPPRMADVNHESHVGKLKEKLEGKQKP